jgi:hypothetical protein
MIWIAQEGFLHIETIDMRMCKNFTQPDYEVSKRGLSYHPLDNVFGRNE